MPHVSERELELPDAIIGKLIAIAAESKNVISLGPGEPDFPLPKPLVQHTKKIADKVNHYSPPGGLSVLRESIARKEGLGIIICSETSKVQARAMRSAS